MRWESGYVSLMDVKRGSRGFDQTSPNPVWHPGSSWGGLTIGVSVAAVVHVVVLFKLGVL